MQILNYLLEHQDTYEYGLEDNTGALQGAFSPGCWRWWGSVRIPAHEWTHTAASYDGATETHWVSGDKVESVDCAGGDLQDRGNTYEFTGLKIGGRTWVPGAEGCGSSGQSSCGVFRGDIDEAMLYGEALAQAQIYSIYHRAYDSNSGGQGITFIRAPTVLKLERLPQGLVGFWPLDGDGDDVSGNNMGGTPSNPDWVAGL